MESKPARKAKSSPKRMTGKKKNAQMKRGKHIVAGNKNKKQDKESNIVSFENSQADLVLNNEINKVKEIYDRIENWYNYLTWGAWYYDRNLFVPGRAFIVSSDGERIIGIGDDNKGSLFEFDYDKKSVSIDLQYLRRVHVYGSPFACPSCGQYCLVLLDSNQQADEGVISFDLNKENRLVFCDCGLKFYFYDGLEGLSLPFEFVELAPLYYYGMPQEADLFLRYVMSDDGNALVEELGTLSYKPQGMSVTEIPPFRFLHWLGDPPSGPSFASEHGLIDVQLWRRRVYQLGAPTFEEGTYHPYLGGWDTVIRKVRKVPDGYAYERMIGALDNLNVILTSESDSANEITQRIIGGDQRNETIIQLWADKENLKGFARMVNKLLPKWRLLKTYLYPGVMRSTQVADKWVSNLWTENEINNFASEFPSFTKDILARAVDHKLKSVDREPKCLACYHAALEFKVDVNGSQLSIIDVYLKYNKGRQPAPTTLLTFYKRGLSLLNQSE